MDLDATIFSRLVGAHYERGSIFLSIGKGYANRGEIFGDSIIAASINIHGDSSQLKERKKAGVLPVVHPVLKKPKPTRTATKRHARP